MSFRRYIEKNTQSHIVFRKKLKIISLLYKWFSNCFTVYKFFEGGKYLLNDHECKWQSAGVWIYKPGFPVEIPRGTHGLSIHLLENWGKWDSSVSITNYGKNSVPMYPGWCWELADTRWAQALMLVTVLPLLYVLTLLSPSLSFFLTSHLRTAEHWPSCLKSAIAF